LKVSLFGLSIEAEGLHALYLALAIAILVIIAALAFVLLDRPQARAFIPSAYAARDICAHASAMSARLPVTAACRSNSTA
jgi:hypothetical protein